MLASWNFKHIVNLQKIRSYNAINFREGHQLLKKYLTMEKKVKKKFVAEVREIRVKITQEIMNLTSDKIIDFYEKRLIEIQQKRKLVVDNN